MFRKILYGEMRDTAEKEVEVKCRNDVRSAFFKDFSVVGQTSERAHTT